VLNGVPVTVAPSDVDDAHSEAEPDSAEFVTGRR
jgi:hypothetical protein